MGTDINKAFHALCAQMVAETDPKKLELLKQRLRLLLLNSGAFFSHQEGVFAISRSIWRTKTVCWSTHTSPEIRFFSLRFSEHLAGSNRGA